MPALRLSYELLFFGSQVAASASLFRASDVPSTASRLTGSYASVARCSAEVRWTPFCQVAESAMTRSIELAEALPADEADLFKLVRGGPRVRARTRTQRVAHDHVVRACA